MKLLSKSFFSVLLLSLTGSAIHATAGRDIATTAKTSVVTCTGRKSRCSSRVNAVGDVITLDVNRATAQDLGVIRDETKVEIDLPMNPGDMKVYSMTPTAGESKDTKIYVVFSNKAQPKGTRLFGKTVIFVHRQFEGEKSNQWSEVARIVSNAPIQSGEITLMADGTAKVQDPINPQETIIFTVGKKDLKS